MKTIICCLLATLGFGLFLLKTFFTVTAMAAIAEWLENATSILFIRLHEPAVPTAGKGWKLEKP